MPFVRLFRIARPAVASREFSDAEIAAFVERFLGTAAWSIWGRRVGTDGADIIEVVLADRRRTVLRLAKTDVDRYAVTGFENRGLMAFDAFSELLDAIAGVPVLADAA